MNKVTGRGYDRSRWTEERDSPAQKLKSILINDFLLTYMLLSPKPIVAVAKSITGKGIGFAESSEGAECYVLEIPWRREC